MALPQAKVRRAPLPRQIPCQMEFLRRWLMKPQSKEVLGQRMPDRVCPMFYTRWVAFSQEMKFLLRLVVVVVFIFIVYSVQTQFSCSLLFSFPSGSSLLEGLSHLSSSSPKPVCLPFDIRLFEWLTYCLDNHPHFVSYTTIYWLLYKAYFCWIGLPQNFVEICWVTMPTTCKEACHSYPTDTPLGCSTMAVSWILNLTYKSSGIVGCSSTDYNYRAMLNIMTIPIAT